MEVVLKPVSFGEVLSMLEGSRWDPFGVKIGFGAGSNGGLCAHGNELLGYKMWRISELVEKLSTVHGRICIHEITQNTATLSSWQHYAY
jgi:hypothetical protein